MVSMSLKEFKEELASIYQNSLKHYGGCKEKARACVEAYCRGLNEGDMARNGESISKYG